MKGIQPKFNLQYSPKPMASLLSPLTYCDVTLKQPSKFNYMFGPKGCTHMLVFISHEQIICS